MATNKPPNGVKMSICAASSLLQLINQICSNNYPMNAINHSANSSFPVFGIHDSSHVDMSSLSAFNWWEENCCIFLKKISSPNAFYLFLPLFKHQTTPYNVLFFQKMKKYAFLFSFQTGTGSQWEGPHNNNKATCIQSKFTIHYILLFST